MTKNRYPFEPSLDNNDISFFRNIPWKTIDQKCSEVLGQPSYGIPSVRVGICWAMEFLGLSRHKDHILVPQFLGRCILNAINRFALPVESPTDKTRLVLVVDQYGFSQDLKKIHEECVTKGWSYIEDSPYGLGEVEVLGPGSLARFIGLSKILPIIQGGCMISNNPIFINWLKKKREKTSHWSWIIWCLMALLRSRRKVSSQSAIAGAAYELYIEGQGGSKLLRGNMMKALELVYELEAEEKRRWEMLEEKLSPRILIPDLRRLSYAVPFLENGQSEALENLFTQEGFDGTSYHVETNRNLFSPHYKKAFLIPMNPRIKKTNFENLVTGLERIILE